MSDTETVEHWVCNDPDCQQTNSQPISEFLYRHLTGTRYKQCSTCRKAKLRANQRRNKEARIAYKKACLLETKSKR